MHVIDLALKDLLQIVRDWKSALLLLLLPIVFTVFFGLMFNPSSGDADPRLPVGIVNRDTKGVLGAGLFSLFEESDAIRPVLLEGEEAARASEYVSDEELAAVIIVPEAFSRRVLADEEDVHLELVIDADAQAGHTARSAIQTAALRLLSGVKVARLSAQAYETKVAFESEAARHAYIEQAVKLASDAWQAPALTVRHEQSGAQSEGVDESTAKGFAQSSPGMIVQFSVHGLVFTATILVLERKTRTLQRLLTTPVSRAQIIAGKMLAMFIVVFVQQALLIAVGQLGFGVDYMRDPLAILLVMVALASWCAALGLLIGASCKSHDQVDMWSLIAMFLFSALGGAWFPLEITGKTFSAIGHTMPSAWAMDGFQNIILRGLGLASVVRPVLIMLAYALLFFVLAVRRFRFE